MGWALAIIEFLVIIYLVRRFDKLIKINYYIANMYMRAAVLKYKKMDDLVNIVYGYVDNPDNDIAVAVGKRMSKDLGLPESAYKNKKVFAQALSQRIELARDPFRD